VEASTHKKNGAIRKARRVEKLNKQKMKLKITLSTFMLALAGLCSVNAANTKAVFPDSAAFTHKIGESFGGGIVFNVYRGADGKEHGLIVAAEEIGRAAWSQNTSQLVGSSSKSDGVANTAAILKAGGSKTEAAGLCDAYEKDGFSDWYLPAIDELDLLYKNIKTEKTSGPQFYWSSTEDHPGSALGYDFNSGASSMSNKHRNGSVKPVRAF
jgi:hypothetical protein